MNKTQEQMNWEDEQFEAFMMAIPTRKRPSGYKKGSFLSLAWMLFKIHRKAKGYDMGSIMSVKLGKDL